MKKAALFTIILAVALGFATTSAYAGKPPEKPGPGVKRVHLTQYVLQEGEENADGWAIINYTPPDDQGTVGVTVQIKVSGLKPNHTYLFVSWGITHAEFTTNSKGKGTCHANLSADADLDPDWEINIRDADDSHKVLGT